MFRIVGGCVVVLFNVWVDVGRVKERNPTWAAFVNKTA
jgi:hypothetical protein